LIARRRPRPAGCDTPAAWYPPSPKSWRQVRARLPGAPASGRHLRHRETADR
jgi:hypothetical protein